ncbi:hypothetical protein BDB01DRAFT_779926 [Pilobolus umbonatus]|nr:hypothetical protein BDB01DRAFT_779926 [Pilobolus umbonatus]
MHSTCTLPSFSDIFIKNTSPRSSVLDINNLLSPSSSEQRNLKAKRKRASPNQLVVLNRIFNQTYFPSTEIRIELGKQLGMSPRTVQIWFQNKRQALRSRGRHHPSESFYLPPISPPRSPTSEIPFYPPSIALPPLRLMSSENSPSLSYPSPTSMDYPPFRDY